MSKWQLCEQEIIAIENAYKRQDSPLRISLTMGIHIDVVMAVLDAAEMRDADHAA